MSRKIRRPIHTLLLLLSSAFLTVACQTSTVEQPDATGATAVGDNCRIVQHEMGETEICGQPQKVAALSPHILDNIVSLGAQPFAFADSDVSNMTLQTFNQPEVQIPYVGQYVTTEPINVGDRKSPSIELLAKIKPDLILSEDWLVKEQYDLLSQIAPTLLFSDENKAKKEQHWRYDIEGIAKALGRDTQAKELLAQHSNQIETVREQLSPIVDAYSKVLVISADDPASTIYTGGGTTPNLLRQVGFEVVSPEGDNPFSGQTSQLSIEALTQIETDLIFVMTWSDEGVMDPQEKVKKIWSEHQLLNQISAYNAGHVFFRLYRK